MKLILLAALFVTPTVVAAQQQSASTAAAPAKSAKPHSGGDTIVCHEDDELGSRIAKKKICMTAAQWREQSAELGRSIDQRTSALSKPGGN